MQCTPEDVWAVLEDAWSYGMWVVGAARIRDVEMHWPQVGSMIHHSVGAWPVLLSDINAVARIHVPESKRIPKVTVLSVAALLGETIQRIHTGASVSATYRTHDALIAH